MRHFRLPPFVILLFGLGLGLVLPVAAAHADNEPPLRVSVSKTGDTFQVDAFIEVTASLQVVWDVLTDFDHMHQVVSNLNQSKVLRRAGNTLQVHQEGVARYGPFSMSFESDREVRLEPYRRILAHGLGGTARRMDSEAILEVRGKMVEIRYHADIEPQSSLARQFGAPFLRHEVEEQFREMVREMQRRNAS